MKILLTTVACMFAIPVWPLEALIEVSSQYVVAVKPDGAAWTPNERGADGVHVVITFANGEYPGIETLLTAQAADGEPHPVKVWPFAEHIPSVGGPANMINRSKVRVNPMKVITAEQKIAWLQKSDLGVVDAKLRKDDPAVGEYSLLAP